jgi:hypothetical protein
MSSVLDMLSFTLSALVTWGSQLSSREAALQEFHVGRGLGLSTTSWLSKLGSEYRVNPADEVAAPTNTFTTVSGEILDYRFPAQLYPNCSPQKLLSIKCLLFQAIKF